MNENNISEPLARSEGKVKKYIVWLTGVLLGIPVLINAGIDVYDAIMNIPKGSAEILSERKRNEHFQEEPLFSHELSIQEKTSKKVLKLFIYPNADIYVNYSGYEQWLPAHNTKTDVVSFMSVISSANAESFISQFGSPKAASPIDDINDPIEIEAVHKQIIDESNKLNVRITRSYWFEEINNQNIGFSPTTRTYNKQFNALDGYKIVSYKIDVVSINNANIVFSRLSNDGSSVIVQFMIRSGPMYDRWQGWLKAQVITEQIKRQQ